MGYGDEVMGSAMARGARARRKRIAFGDGTRINWSQWAPVVYANNPNVAPPGSEGADDLEWIPYYRGSRWYAKPVADRWVWNYEFKTAPGQFFFSEAEDTFGRMRRPGYFVIEPNLPTKDVAVNKRWPLIRYQATADALRSFGIRVLQMAVPGRANDARLRGAEIVHTPSFRDAAVVLKYAGGYIGPEGGLHHAAAAVGCKAVVLFGGFIPPQVTGYDDHVNLTGGAEACGSRKHCDHCKQAMDAITVDQVVMNARAL